MPCFAFFFLVIVWLHWRVLRISVTLDAVQRGLVIEFCSVFFSWLLTGLSNLPGEVSASAKFSLRWRYLHYPLSTLEHQLPFLPHCLERHELCCRERSQGRGHEPALALSLLTVVALLSAWIGWPLVFLPSKLLSQLEAAFCWCEADKRIGIPFTRLYSVGITGKGATGAHTPAVVTCLTLSTGIMSVICK